MLLTAMKKLLFLRPLPLRWPAAVLAFAASVATLVAVSSYLGIDQRQLNLPALGLIIGGTLLATCISDSASAVKNLLACLCTRERNSSATHTLDEITAMAKLWVQNDVRKMEEALTTLTDPVLRTGVQLLIHQTPAHQILDLLHARIARLHNRDMAQAQMLHAMANFASAFGVLGAVLELVGVVGRLDTSAMASVGPQFAVALMNLVYGLACAALIFRPLALRQTRRSQARLATMQLVVPGIAMMIDKRGPAALRAALQTLVDTEETPALHRHLVGRFSHSVTPARAQPAPAPSLRPARLLHGCHATPF